MLQPFKWSAYAGLWDHLGKIHEIEATNGQHVKVVETFYIGGERECICPFYINLFDVFSCVKMGPLTL